MRLSADRINRKSPYWVIQLDELTFRFVTKNGILYRVGFYQDRFFLGSMILRNDHPEYDELLTAYREFVQRASSLYQIQPK